MSKLTRALEVIQHECDEHFMCDECPLGYKRNDGDYGCRIDEWCTSKVLRPRNWPIAEVLKRKGEGAVGNAD